MYAPAASHFRHDVHIERAACEVDRFALRLKNQRFQFVIAPISLEINLFHPKTLRLSRPLPFQPSRPSNRVKP